MDIAKLLGGLMHLSRASNLAPNETRAPWNSMLLKPSDDLFDTDDLLFDMCQDPADLSFLAKESLVVDWQRMEPSSGPMV